MRKHICDEARLTQKERVQKRQSLETKELLTELRSILDCKLSKNPKYRSLYYTEALNNLNRFGEKIIANLNDGELPIDNNLIERTIRKLTTQYNNSLHYGSDVGTEKAVTNHSVVETVKPHDGSIWNFIGNIFNISLMSTGIMLTWFKTKSLWLQANVNFKINY